MARARGCWEKSNGGIGALRDRRVDRRLPRLKTALPITPRTDSPPTSTVSSIGSDSAGFPDVALLAATGDAGGAAGCGGGAAAGVGWDWVSATRVAGAGGGAADGVAANGSGQREATAVDSRFASLVPAR